MVVGIALIYLHRSVENPENCHKMNTGNERDARGVESFCLLKINGIATLLTVMRSKKYESVAIRITIKKAVKRNTERLLQPSR